MERINFNYSLKNISRGSRQEYFKALVNWVEDFITRLRWKVYAFDNNEEAPDNPRGTYGFRTAVSPPVIKDLTAFESDMHKMITCINFRSVNSDFLDRLDKDAKKIKSSDKAIIPADKTSNYYQLPVEKYHHLINKNITAEYRKAPPGTVEKINRDAGDIANSINLRNRMRKYQTSQAFVLLKDHKPNFNQKLPCRLINPAKSDIGKVSKCILEDMTSQLRTSLSLNQWKSTSDVIHWFNNNCIGKVYSI